MSDSTVRELEELSRKVDQIAATVNIILRHVRPPDPVTQAMFEAKMAAYRRRKEKKKNVNTLGQEGAGSN